MYPLLAVIDEVRVLAPSAEFFYIGSKTMLQDEFLARNIKIYTVFSSKLRRYFDVMNFVDIPRFFISFLQSLWHLYGIMPDVIFSKGGPGALGVTLAAAFYMIPVMIHESDAVPGLTNSVSGKFAKRIGITFPFAARYFSASKVAVVGNPARKELFTNPVSSEQEAKIKLGFDTKLPLLLVLGGSQGSKRVNNFIFDAIADLTEFLQIYHVVGENNKKDRDTFLQTIPKENEKQVRERYKSVAFIDAEEMKIALSAADVVLSRAGSGALTEIAAFGKPALLVPLKESAGDHQRVNAYEYEKLSGAMVIEENNFSPHLVISELKNILKDETSMQRALQGGRQFFKPDAARVISEEIIRLVK